MMMTGDVIEDLSTALMNRSLALKRVMLLLVC